ncbi:PrsW family intramembrane metalloprotease [Spirochaeta cellobiosiphila]|uniref:PrsW family intramembrane metalloprotease n=1 Tax=Spirochaeta cellobiosiphila TaxID=504483 RepID=UPI00041ADC63|nr:PrsW family glutamic-type intramembrane protease [Spirochaeta cellobiosiphila]
MGTRLIAFVLALIPGILIIIHFYKKDSTQPEPKRLVLKVFLGGVLCTLPALILELFFGFVANSMSLKPLIQVLFNSYIIAGFSEEIMKFLVVWIFIYKSDDFDQVIDGIVYTVAASMGFACLENILYVNTGGIGVALIRGLTSVPLHASASGIMGFYLGRAKLTGNLYERNRLIQFGLLCAILIHGTYDFVLFVQPITPLPTSYLSIFIVIVSMMILNGLIKKTKQYDIASY